MASTNKRRRTEVALTKEQCKTLLQRLRYYAKALAGKPVLITDDRVLTYGQLWQQVTEFPGHVQKKGGFISVASNVPESQLVDWLGALHHKLKPVIMHPDMNEERLTEVEARCMAPAPGKDTADFGVLSSGSTGVPKVLWRALRSWEEFFDEQNRVFQVNEATVLFFHGSLSFTGNLNSIAGVLYAGGTLVTSAHMSPKTWHRLCDQYGVTHLYLLPTKLRLLLPILHEPLPMLSMIFTGSQRLDHKLMAMLREKLPKTQFVLYYGASELNYITYCTYEEWLAEPNTVGYPFHGVEVEVRPDHSIYVTTPYGIEGITMPFSVGDKGHWTESGRLNFEGRGSSVINRGGVKLSVADLESRIGEMTGVAAVAVIGVPDELRDEEPVAFIVPEPDVERSVISQAMKDGLSAVEQPKSIMWVDKLPLNSSSKIDIKALRTMWEDR